jgi:7,8-dihydro-6-hydroxymethylpterin dimethyltransferase
MTEWPAPTESLCPHCLRRIPARRVLHSDSVCLEKSCPEHGALDSVLLWNSASKSYTDWSRPAGPNRIDRLLSPAAKGCPYDCGICSNHRQDACTAILEVTGRCNLDCPVCFAASNQTLLADPERDQIKRMLQRVSEFSGPIPIQISGGEPTLRDDLPDIVALAFQTGFNHVQVNTNGIRLAQDADYGLALKHAGTTTIFLQFDGLSDQVYRRMRGADLMHLKQRAIERCAELKIGVILVPTLMRGVNDNQIGPIIQFAKRWIPVVKGVHFQPMTWLGRYPHSPRNEERFLLPDVLAEIEIQTTGELKVDNFIPPG